MRRARLASLLLALLASSAVMGDSRDPTGALGRDEPFFGGLAAGAETVRMRRGILESMVQEAGSRDTVKQRLSTNGWSYLRGGDALAAIRAFNDLWLLDPSDGQAYWGLATAVSQTERPEHDAQAALLFDRAWSLLPGNARLASDIGRFHLRKGPVSPDREQVEEAGRWASRSLALDARCACAHVTMAMVHFARGDYAQAWTSVELAQSLELGSVPAPFLDRLRAASPTGREAAGSATAVTK